MILRVIFLSLFFVMFLVNLFSHSAFCQSQYGAKLSEIEKNYYGYTFGGDDESRLTRLEQAVYGSTIKQSTQSRVNKLYKDLNISTQSSKLTTGGAAPVNNSKSFVQNIGPKADSNIKYPIVDKMEQQILQKTFANEDIYNRLSRLEKQVFPNQNKSTLSLNERVDALRGKILGGTKVATVDIDPMTEEIVLENGRKYYGDDDAKSYFNKMNEEQSSNYNYYSYENSKSVVPETSSQNLGDNGVLADKYAQSYDLDILEKNLLGQRYTSETSSKRLNRLESKVFQRTFSDSDEARIQRLLAVTTAQKTSQEYDSNKWARRLNAGMQIGSILLMVLAMIL